MARLQLISYALLIAVSLFHMAIAQDPWINEFHYDNSGADTGEFIEIAGTAGTDLTDYKIYLYNGANDQVYDGPLSFAISTIPDQGDGIGTAEIAFPTNGLQNGGPDGIALIGPSDTVTQFLSYEGSFTANGGPASGMTSVDIGVFEPGSTATGTSLSLIGTGTQYGDFTWASGVPETPGDTNVCQNSQEVSGNVWINEIHYDNAGTDTDEFVEIAGEAGIDLSEYAIYLYNGATGALYDGPLSSFNVAVIPDQEDGFGTAAISLATDGLQNGAPDGIALVHVSSCEVMQFLSYEGTFAASEGFANGMTSVDIGVFEPGSTAAGTSLSLTGTGNQYDDFTWAYGVSETEGSINTGQTMVAPTPAPTTPAPTTPAPTTPAPTTPAPTTPAPTTPEPTTPEPTTPEPTTPEPTTPAPTTPAPTTPAPITPAPITPSTTTSPVFTTDSVSDSFSIDSGEESVDFAANFINQKPDDIYLQSVTENKENIKVDLSPVALVTVIGICTFASAMFWIHQCCLQPSQPRKETSQLQSFNHLQIL